MKILRFDYQFNDNEEDGNCLRSTFVVPQDDEHSKNFVMATIRSILTSVDGEFKLNSFKLYVESGNNCASNLVNMRKMTENRLKGVFWTESKNFKKGEKQNGKNTI